MLQHSQDGNVLKKKPGKKPDLTACQIGCSSGGASLTSQDFGGKKILPEKKFKTSMRTKEGVDSRV